MQYIITGKQPNQLIRVFSVCFNDIIRFEVHLNICSRHKKQITFSRQKTVKPVFSGHSKIDKTKDL